MSTSGDMRGRRGLTLVEIMVAVLVLAALAIGGWALVYNSRADILVQKYKRAAIETANARMEELMRQWAYTNLAALIGSPLVETVSLCGISDFDMTTTVAAGGGAVDDCLRVTVSVEYRPGSGEVVSLETLRSD